MRRWGEALKRWIVPGSRGRVEVQRQTFTSVLRSAIEQDNGLILGIDGFEKWIGNQAIEDREAVRVRGSLRRRSRKIFGSFVRVQRTVEE